MVKVSVIIPVYNVEKYLRECLDSILGQTLKEMEVVCVDDGSTDGSGAILDAAAGQDPRVRVIHQANAGAGPARNAGLAAATGEYVSFCDPDDWCRRDMLERLYSEAKAKDCDLVLSGMRRFEFGTDKSNVALPARVIRRLPRPFSPRQVGRQLFTAGRANPVAKLLRRSFLLERHIEFQSLLRENDLFFSFIALAKARRISCVNAAFYCYRMGRPNSLQTSLRKTGHPLCWLEAFHAVRSRLADDGELALFAGSLMTTLLGMGTRAMLKLGGAENIGLFYDGLRKEAIDLSAIAGTVEVLSDKEREQLELLRQEVSPIPLLQLKISRLQAWRQQVLYERAHPLALAARILGKVIRRLRGRDV